MPATIYGIANCDTVKKARSWLAVHAVDAVFHDYKLQGIGPERLSAWCRRLGWQALVNRGGTTWRKLPETDRSDLDEAKAIALMAAQPSLIKRPVLEVGGHVEVGFSPLRYAAIFHR